VLIDGKSSPPTGEMQWFLMGTSRALAGLEQQTANEPAQPLQCTVRVQLAQTQGAMGAMVTMSLL